MTCWSRLLRGSLILVLIPILVLVTGVFRILADGPTHTVQPGENLFRIALRYGTTVEALAAANQISDPTRITVGEVLIIPGGADTSQTQSQQQSQPQAQTQTQTQAQNQAPAQPPVQPSGANAAPVYYTVQDGDTLNIIAQKFGVTWVDIANANHLTDANVITLGQQIVIPGVASPGGSATVPSVAADPSQTTVPAAPAVPAAPITVPPTTAPPAAPAVQTYIVQAGEGLAAIGRKLNVYWPLIAEANNLTDPNTIYQGMTLKIPASDAAAPAPTTMETSTGVPPGPPPSLPTGKYIKIVLREQRVYAYENGVLVHTTLGSTGLPGTPTVQGDFKIYLKYTSQLMTGPGYYLPGVPWVMYFYESYGLHGTYWHHNWGHPMSHGCVNLPTDEALWYYNWADVGTPVHVEW